MIRELIVNVLCSFSGTIAYSVLYNVPKKYYVCCGMTGAAGWLVYKALVQGISPAIASFFGTLVVVLISRMLTVRMKCPITIFLVSGIFPLVPGAGVYYTAYYLVTNQLSLSACKVNLEVEGVAFKVIKPSSCVPCLATVQRSPNGETLGGLFREQCSVGSVGSDGVFHLPLRVACNALVPYRRLQ